MDTKKLLFGVSMKKDFVVKILIGSQFSAFKIGVI